MKDRYIRDIIIAGVTGITVMELLALAMGHNGILLVTAVGAVSTIIGWALGKKVSINGK